jgi:hypothetical protein
MRLFGASAKTLFACAVALSLTLSACGGSATDQDPGQSDAEGPTRAFRMGFSSLPRELTDERYEEAFALAGDYGDLILIQRVLPWEEFLPGGAVSDDTIQTTQAERALAEENELALFVAIDPTDGAEGRSCLVGLPEDLEGSGFTDPDIRTAVISYAQYVALNYEPNYLALGVEMNMYYQHDSDDFDAFVSLYFDAYDAVKELSPDTLVFPTFQMEELQSLLPASEGHPPQWHLLRRFEPKLDLVAISTYPSFAFDTPGDIPDDYYRQLETYTDRPIAIAEMGYSSGPCRQGINDGTEKEQKDFLTHMLLESENMDMPFLVWFAGWDPTFASDPPLDLFQHIGLLRSDGSEKPSWKLWVQAAQRPLAEPEGVRLFGR